MNSNWNKETNMSEGDKYNLHEYRITELEKHHSEVVNDLKEIKEVVNRLDKKLAAIPESGLSCQVHFMKLNDCEERLKKVESLTYKIHTKIVFYSGVFAVILFIIGKLLIPIATNLISTSNATPVQNTPYEWGVTNK